MLTSRQRVRGAIGRQPVDHVPCDLWAEPEVYAALRDHLGVGSDEEVRRALGIDMRWLVPEYIGQTAQTCSEDATTDFLGITRRKISYGRGAYWEISHYPLASAESIADISNHPWPNPEDWDYEAIASKIAESDAQGELWLGIGSGSFFERAWNMRGMENFLVDLATDPKFACALMDRLGEFYLEHTQRILQAAGGRVDMLYTADDIGAQSGLIISLGMWRKYVMPRQAAFNDHFKRKYGVKVFYHSCGAIDPIIPYLIEIGVDILNPLQFSAQGMDPVKTKRDFGDRLTFHGGIDVQTTLATGSVHDILAEVEQRLDVLGEGGGYILAPAHCIQTDTSVDKIIAMYQRAQKTI